jgi:hypothetical protein
MVAAYLNLSATTMKRLVQDSRADIRNFGPPKYEAGPF